MKKVKRILILALILVVTLNINYLKMIDKRIIVESSEYKAGNTDNLVLNKILSDNQLKTEIPHMFNYASNGNQAGLENPDYITKGLYNNIDEDGTTYYYRGDIDNNNIIFGAYEEDYYVYGNGRSFYQSKESCVLSEGRADYCDLVKVNLAGDKMYWKIVRVNGDGSLRLIYNGPGIKDTMLASSFKDEKVSGAIGIVPYNLENNDPKYAGYTYDNGTDSFIKKEVDTWYNNTLGSNPDYDKYVILGRYCSDISGYRYDETFGINIFESYDRLGQVEYNFAKDNAPSFICPNTNESYGGSYRLKAGLITADELVYAGESAYVTGNSYLNPGEDFKKYWSMTPIYFDGYASVWNEHGYLREYYVNSSSGIRPVINIKTEGMTLTGDGTLDNPYMLEEVEPTNSYKGKVTIEVGSSIDDIKAFEENLDLSNVAWTVKDSYIAKIENGKIIGLKNGTTVITGVGSDGTSYEIEVTVISNPITSSAVYIVIGLILVLLLGTGIYVTYKVNNVIDKE